VHKITVIHIQKHELIIVEL